MSSAIPLNGVAGPGLVLRAQAELDGEEEDAECPPQQSLGAFTLLITRRAKKEQKPNNTHLCSV